MALIFRRASKPLFLVEIIKLVNCQLCSLVQTCMAWSVYMYRVCMHAWLKLFCSVALHSYFFFFTFVLSYMPVWMSERKRKSKKANGQKERERKRRTKLTEWVRFRICEMSSFGIFTSYILVILIASGLNYSYFNWDCCYWYISV